MKFKTMSNKIKVTTTIDRDIYKWIKEQSTLSNWIETLAKEMQHYKYDIAELKTLQRRVSFFGDKTVELQADLKTLKSENTRILMKFNALKRKINGKIDEKEPKKGQKSQK